MGSWGFVFGAPVCPGRAGIGRPASGFDAYPWILLNLVRSCFAAPQGAIRWIAVKRSDQIDSGLRRRDHETSCDADEIVHVVQDLSQAIAARVGVALATSGGAS